MESTENQDDLIIKQQREIEKEVSKVEKSRRKFNVGLTKNFAIFFRFRNLLL